MPEPRRRVTTALAVALTALVTATLTACGSGSSDTPDVPTTTPQTPISAPPLQATPAGTVVPAPASQSMALDPASKALAVLDAGGASVQIFSTAVPGTVGTPRRIPLPSPATSIGAFTDGTLVALARKSVALVTVASGVVRTVATSVENPSSVVRLSDRSLVVGTSAGSIVHLRSDGTVVRTITGFVRVDGLAVAPRSGDDDHVVALDRAQSSITSVDIDNGTLGAALRAGDGATSIVVDHYGRFLTTDTRGNELLGFFGEPLVAKFRYPVAAGPYAVGYDDTDNLAWVATTGNNQIVSYDLSTGIPVERRRLATVGQADSIAVDSTSGTVYVLSARGEGLQIIR